MRLHAEAAHAAREGAGDSGRSSLNMQRLLLWNFQSAQKTHAVLQKGFWVAKPHIYARRTVIYGLHVAC